jgi:hypothetical protein
MKNIKKEYWVDNGVTFEKHTEYNTDGSIKEVLLFKNNILIKKDSRNEYLRNKRI